MEASKPVIERIFNAPRGRVWQAWTETEHLADMMRGWNSSLDKLAQSLN